MQQCFNLSELTSAVAVIAKEGGKFLREQRRIFHPEQIEQKHEHDYVSYVDRQSEQLLVERLHALLPQAGFITEEGTMGSIDEDKDVWWVIDPLDGTTNYIRDISPYCVSIALRSRDQLLCGVVYEVCRDELYTAWKDGPACLNGKRIHVSSTNRIKEAYSILELPYNASDYQATAQHLLHQLYGRVACIRMPGSAAAAICYVAAGRFDIWMESFIGRWDYSAAALILRQAGGRVTDFYGNEAIMDTHHIVATNGQFHSDVLKWLTQSLPLHLDEFRK